MPLTIENHCQGCLRPGVTLYSDPRGLMRAGDQHPALWCLSCYRQYVGTDPSPSQRVVLAAGATV